MPQTNDKPIRMTAREKYRFDTQGFLVVKGALTPEEVARINDTMDANQDKVFEREHEHGGSTTLAGAVSRAAYGMFEWPAPHCDPFRDLIVHPKAIGYLNDMLGRGWHLDHPPVYFQAGKGSGGQALHLGDYLWVDGAYYIYKAGQIRSGLTVLQWVLAEQGGELGGFACIPGSHKSNFPRPADISLWHEDQDMVACPKAEPGDLIIFSEATTHGALPWNADHDRRAVLYRYAPRFVQFGPGYHAYQLPEWTSALSEQAKSALEPAYIYNRQIIHEDGSVERPYWDLEIPDFPQ